MLVEALESAMNGPNCAIPTFHYSLHRLASKAGIIPSLYEMHLLKAFLQHLAIIRFQPFT